MRRLYHTSIGQVAGAFRAWPVSMGGKLAGTIIVYLILNTLLAYLASVELL